jgi:hypothetical protein
MACKNIEKIESFGELERKKGLLQLSNQKDVLASRPKAVVGLVEPGREESKNIILCST